MPFIVASHLCSPFGGAGRRERNLRLLGTNEAVKIFGVIYIYMCVCDSNALGLGLRGNYSIF